jgi:RNA polymerase sigma factor (sigma-70 family)
MRCDDMDGETRDDDLLADRFAENGDHLRAVATRILGSRAEADDAVQEAWLRLSRSDADDIDNLRAWLTTVVSRVCLDMLRSRRSRREETLDTPGPGLEPDSNDALDPEQEAVLGDSVGVALLVVLDSLTPPERVAFVLHDLFAVPFDEIAPIVGRTPAATRQLASRARRRVQGSGARPDADLARQRELVGAFLAASRAGDLTALLALLDPDVVLCADTAAIASGAPAEVRGADDVAATFAGRARAAQPAIVDGVAALVWAQRGEVRVVFDLTFADGRITAIDLLADPELVRELDVQLLDG